MAETTSPYWTTSWGQDEGLDQTENPEPTAEPAPAPPEQSPTTSPPPNTTQSPTFTPTLRPNLNPESPTAATTTTVRNNTMDSPDSPTDDMGNDHEEEGADNSGNSPLPSIPSASNSYGSALALVQSNSTSSSLEENSTIARPNTRSSPSIISATFSPAATRSSSNDVSSASSSSDTGLSVAAIAGMIIGPLLVLLFLALFILRRRWKRNRMAPSALFLSDSEKWVPPSGASLHSDSFHDRAGGHEFAASRANDVYDDKTPSYAWERFRDSPTSSSSHREGRAPAFPI